MKLKGIHSCDLQMLTAFPLFLLFLPTPLTRLPTYVFAHTRRSIAHSLADLVDLTAWKWKETSAWQARNVTDFFCKLRTFAPIATAHLSCARYTSRDACHVMYSSARTESKLNKYRADDLCGNLICEYFCWMLGDPHFFFRQITSFSVSFHYT